MNTVTMAIVSVASDFGHPILKEQVKVVTAFMKGGDYSEIYILGNHDARPSCTCVFEAGCIRLAA